MEGRRGGAEALGFRDHPSPACRRGREQMCPVALGLLRELPVSGGISANLQPCVGM